MNGVTAVDEEKAGGAGLALLTPEGGSKDSGADGDAGLEGAESHSAPGAARVKAEKKGYKAPSSFWILSLKFISSALFVAALTVALIKGLLLFVRGNQLSGLLLFLGVSLSAFIALAFVMVFLNQAQDTAEMRAILGRIRRG